MLSMSLHTRILVGTPIETARDHNERALCMRLSLVNESAHLLEQLGILGLIKSYKFGIVTMRFEMH